MVGSWTVLVNGVRPFTIHGDLYYELTVARTDDTSESNSSGGFLLRVPQHATASPPEPGQRLIVTFLMGQVTTARPA
jgi:hypothetical protein